MPEEKNNEIENLKKAHPDFFKKVPPELIDFIFSEKTFAQITDVCVNNDIEEEKIEDIAYRITLALLKKLPKENLAYALEKGAGIAPEVANKISSEANRLIFSKIPSSEAPETKKPAPLPPFKKEESAIESPKPPKREDTYREKIE